MIYRLNNVKYPKETLSNGLKDESHTNFSENISKANAQL